MTMRTPQGFDSAVFGNLPDVMVQALLERSSEVSDALTARVDKLAKEQPDLRKRALREGIIIKLPKSVPEADGKTVVAVDGSATVERMAGTDVYAAAAVRVAGYGKKVEPKPRDFQVKVHPVEGLADGRRMNLALMGIMECELAAESETENDLVLFDGTVFSVVLASGLALRGIGDRGDALSKLLDRRWLGVRPEIPKLLRSDTLAAIPKRSTADNEFVRHTRIFVNEESDLTGLATANLILEAGEYTTPLPLPTERLGLRNTPLESAYVDCLNLLLDEMRVVYFRPREWSPAYRIELAPHVAEKQGLLQRQLALIRKQCVNSAMREPYPVYLADRFVRSLSKGMAAVVEAVRGEVTAKSENVELTSRFIGPGRTEPYQEVDPE